MAGLYLPTDGDRLYEDDGTIWRGFGPLYPLTKPPAVSTWTWQNQGTATAVDSQDTIFWTSPVSPGSATNVRALFRALPATPYKITAVIMPALRAVATNMCGLYLRNATSGLVKGMVLGCSAAWPPFLTVAKWNSLTSFNASYGGPPIPQIPRPAFLRIEDDGTTITWSYSEDGLNWIVAASTGHTDWVTADTIGFGGDASNPTWGPSATLLSWKVE